MEITKKDLYYIKETALKYYLDGSVPNKDTDLFNTLCFVKSFLDILSKKGYISEIEIEDFSNNCTDYNIE